MSNCRLLIILVISCLLGSCNPAKLIVDFDERKIAAPLFHDIIPDADSIIIYKTSFIEKYVANAKTGVLEFSVLNEQEKGRAFKYLSLKGDSQDIYLARFMKNKQSQFIYLSVKYGSFPGERGQPKVHCKGFGPAYSGALDTVHLYSIHPDTIYNVINLGTAVKINANGTMSRKSGKNPRPVFIPAELLTNNSHDTIRIKEIMFGEHNKYGGRRPVVMPMNTIFIDKNIDCLNFRYLKNNKHTLT